MTETPATPREHLRSETVRAALRIQHRILIAARAYLDGQGFVELQAPLIGPVTDPGGRGSKQVDVDFYGHRYKLMTSAILYKQASLLAFDRIYCVAPNVRLEPLETSGTRRHLVEFRQLDIEIAGGSRDDAMAVAEGIIQNAVRAVIDSPELKGLGRDPGAFAHLLDGPFDRRTHTDAVADLIDIGHHQNPDGEIDWAGERIISEKASRPFFIVDYPKGSRGFYDRENPDRPGFLRNFDLIAPEGFGELISGSEREADFGRAVTRIRETGENPAKYAWYLELLRQGVPYSAGFGLGLERFTRYVAGLDSVVQATAFPKIAGQVSP
jgi:asparaginyl-tRNA synthetase